MSNLTDEQVKYYANPGQDLRLINRRTIPRLAQEVLDLREKIEDLEFELRFADDSEAS